MYNANEYKICFIKKSDLTLEQMNYADSYQIITIGERATGHYTIKIGETKLDYTSNSLKDARIISCNYLVTECSYESNIFRSVCFTPYDRKINPQRSYFQLVRR